MPSVRDSGYFLQLHPRRCTSRSCNILKKTPKQFFRRKRVLWVFVLYCLTPCFALLAILARVLGLDSCRLYFKEQTGKIRSPQRHNSVPLSASAPPVQRGWTLPARCCVDLCPRPATTPAQHRGLVPGAAGPERAPSSTSRDLPSPCRCL